VGEKGREKLSAKRGSTPKNPQTKNPKKKPSKNNKVRQEQDHVSKANSLALVEAKGTSSERDLGKRVSIAKQRGKAPARSDYPLGHFTK